MRNKCQLQTKTSHVFLSSSLPQLPFSGLPLVCVCVRQFVEHTYVSGRGKPVPTHTHTHTHKLKSAINWWAQTDWKEIKQSRVEPSWWQFIVHTCNWWWCLGDQANTNVCHVCVRMRVCICQGIFHCLAVPKSRLYKLPAIILRLCQYSKIYWRYIAI